MRLLQKFSACEIDAVKHDNNWKFIKDDKNSKMIKQNAYVCLN